MTKESTSTKHIDKSVLYLFSILSVIAIITLGYKKANYYSCENVAYSITSNSSATAKHHVGSVVNFNDFTEDATHWEWNFGDSSKVSNRRNPLHSYKYSGRYIVTLRINNSCILEEEILVLDSVAAVDSSRFPVFSVPKYIRAGEELKVVDRTDGAITWDWRFGENTWEIGIKQTSFHVYNTPGEKIVSLVVNGDKEYIAYKRILVLENEEELDIADVIGETGSYGGPTIMDGIPSRPPVVEGGSPVQVASVPSVYEDVTRAKFIHELEAIAEEGSGLETVLKRMCGGPGTLVTVGKKKTSMTLDELYDKIKGKKINIKRLSLVKDMNTNCVTTFDLRYRVVFLNLKIGN